MSRSLNRRLPFEAPTTKRCGRCERELGSEMFNRCAKNRDDLSYSCRECARVAKKAWHEAHKDEQNAACRDYYRTHSEAAKLRARAWERQHHERAKARSDRYVKDNAERIRLLYLTPEGRAKRRRQLERWRRNNRDRARETCRRQQAVRRHAAKASPVSYEAVYARDKGICYLCEEPVSRDKMDRDHVIPLSKGGSHTFDNIRTTHPSCNRRKGNKLVEPGAYAVRKTVGEHSS